MAVAYVQSAADNADHFSKAVCSFRFRRTYWPNSLKSS